MANKLRGASARAKTKAQISSALSAILDDDVETPQTPVTDPAEQGSRDRLIEVPLTQLYPNDDQPRLYIDSDALERLANSIKRQGLLQPILVGPLDEHGKRMIIAGERRFRAMQRLGRDSITAMEYDQGVREVPIEAEQATALMAELALVENLERKDLNVVETALAYQNMMSYHGHNQSSLARALGISRHDIVRHVKVLDLPEDIQDQVVEHGLSKTAAYMLAEFLREEDAQKALGMLIRGEISTMGLRKKVQDANVAEERRLNGEAPPKALPRAFDFQKTFRSIERSVTSVVESRDSLSPAQRDQIRALRDQLDQLLTEEGE